MRKDGGGLAFPLVGEHEKVIETGLTIRDYFAAMAMQGMYANDADSYDFNGVAAAAYRTADAMLKEREK